MSGFERVAMCVYCLSNVPGCYSDVGNAKRLLVMLMPCMLASLASIWFRLGVEVGVGTTGITNTFILKPVDILRMYMWGVHSALH